MKTSQTPWMAVKGDVLNPDRTWGIVRYLSREDCEAVDGEDATWPSRTEVIAEVCSASDGIDEGDARLLAAAPEMLAALKRVREAFYVKGTSKALRAAFEGTKELVAKAEGRQP